MDKMDVEGNSQKGKTGHLEGDGLVVGVVELDRGRKDNSSGWPGMI